MQSNLGPTMTNHDIRKRKQERWPSSQSTSCHSRGRDVCTRQSVERVIQHRTNESLARGAALSEGRMMAALQLRSDSCSLEHHWNHTIFLTGFLSCSQWMTSRLQGGWIATAVLCHQSLLDALLCETQPWSKQGAHPKWFHKPCLGDILAYSHFEETELPRWLNPIWLRWWMVSR